MSMYEVPDAPWIREAEMYGVGNEPDPECPCCHDEPSEVAYYDKETGAEIGCDCCIEAACIDLSNCPEFFPKLAGDQPEEPDPVCPCCGRIPDGTAYYNRKHGYVEGCDRCIETRDINDMSANPTYYGG